MSCTNCLTRREFLAKSGFAVTGAAVLAACGDGQFGPSSTTTTATDKVTVKVGSIAALATVGQLVKIPPSSAFIVVKRTGATTFLAFSSVCTHEGTPTALEGNILHCYNHEAMYDSNGAVTKQPNNGGRATNLPTYPTSYDAASDILTIG